MARAKAKKPIHLMTDPHVVATLIVVLIFVSRIAVNYLVTAPVVTATTDVSQVIVARELIYVIYDTVLIVLGLAIGIKSVITRHSPILHLISFIAVALAFLAAWDLVEMYGQIILLVHVD
jgi:hypothetical protein